MSFVSWFKKLVGINVREAAEANTVDPSLPDLREFVYLDEVSLRSLLSSQKGGVTDSTSEQSTDGRAAEIASTVGANPGFVAKAEVVSRYQTSNSSTIQTSRKATVQSWFRELHLIPTGACLIGCEYALLGWASERLAEVGGDRQGFATTLVHRPLFQPRYGADLQLCGSAASNAMISQLMRALLVDGA